MLSQLSHMGLELNVHGLPKWMAKMNPDKMSSKQRHHIVSHAPIPFPEAPPSPFGKCQCLPPLLRPLLPQAGRQGQTGEQGMT